MRYFYSAYLSSGKDVSPVQKDWGSKYYIYERKEYVHETKRKSSAIYPDLPNAREKSTKQLCLCEQWPWFLFQKHGSMMRERYNLPQEYLSMERNWDLGV